MTAVTEREPASSETIRRFSLDEYHWLIRHGFFKPEDRLELINGYVVEMSPIAPPHAYSVGQIYESLVRQAGARATIRSQQPMTLISQASEPEPDIVVAEPPPQRYIGGHPQPENVMLVCEVSDTTLTRDRTSKLHLYAAAGIREYWIVNLAESVVEVYRDPMVSGRRASYATRLEFVPGQQVAPQALPECLIEISQILPERGSEEA